MRGDDDDGEGLKNLKTLIFFPLDGVESQLREV
jgi:hypothetical protein